MVNYKYNYQLFYGGFYYESKNEKIQCIASILHSAFFNYSMAFSLVMCLLNAHSIKKYTGFHQEITKTFIKPALSAAVMGAVCFVIQYAVQSVLPFGRVCFAVCVIIAVPVGALIYFAAIIKLKVFTEEELTKIPKGNLIVKLAKKLHLL